MAIFLLHKNKFDNLILFACYFLCENLQNALLSGLEISPPHSQKSFLCHGGKEKILAIISNWHLVNIVHKGDK